MTPISKASFRNNRKPPNFYSLFLSAKLISYRLSKNLKGHANSYGPLPFVFDMQWFVSSQTRQMRGRQLINKTDDVTNNEMTLTRFLKAMVLWLTRKQTRTNLWSNSVDLKCPHRHMWTMYKDSRDRCLKLSHPAWGVPSPLLPHSFPEDQMRKQVWTDAD